MLYLVKCSWQIQLCTLYGIRCCIVINRINGKVMLLVESVCLFPHCPLHRLTFELEFLCLCGSWPYWQSMSTSSAYGRGNIAVMLSELDWGQLYSSVCYDVWTGCDNEPGELYIKGSNMFQLYWNKPDATKETFTADGWFKTGTSQVSYNIFFRCTSDHWLQADPVCNWCRLVGWDAHWTSIHSSSLIDSSWNRYSTSDVCCLYLV